MGGQPWRCFREPSLYPLPEPLALRGVCAADHDFLQALYFSSREDLHHALPEGAALVSTGAVVTGLAAVLGHMFTFWLGFKGGKGVATTTGVLLGIAPIAMLGGLAVWLAFFFTMRYVSLASMMAGVGVAVTMLIQMSRSGQWDMVMLGFGLLIMLLVIVRHRANIQRIIAGTEPKAGQKK